MMITPASICTRGPLWHITDWEADEPQNFLLTPLASILLLEDSHFTISKKFIRYRRYFGVTARKHKRMIEARCPTFKSRYGYTWRGINRPYDRESGIAGESLLFLTLQTNEVVAVRRGYIRTGDVRNSLTGVWWLGGQVCPTLRSEELAKMSLLHMRFCKQGAKHAR